MIASIVASSVFALGSLPNPPTVFWQNSDTPSLNATDLELVYFVSWANTYAPYQFECRGRSPKEARREAKRALGRRYIARLGKVSAKLSAEHGAEAVEQAGIHVVPGYKLNSRTCQRFAKLVPDALDSLRELERRTEDNR